MTGVELVCIVPLVVACIIHLHLEYRRAVRQDRWEREEWDRQWAKFDRVLAELEEGEK